MKIRKFKRQQDFQNVLAYDPDIREHAAFEVAIMSRRQGNKRFSLEGYCKVCERPTTFLVDRLFGAQETAEGWLPNWRERLVCTHCHLKNRLRAMLHAIKEVALTRLSKGQSVSLYAMEQITSLFAWLNKQSQQIENLTCVGSEYLGEKIEGGTIVDGIIKGIRHENIEALSFADHSFDIITSNDVLEHVNLPEQAIAEMYRVLKKEGEIFITIPFHLNAFQTIRRAQLVNGEIKHLLPPLYHGNPLSKKGSLVFNDFGWEFLEQLKAAGFCDVSLCHYWSYLYGYLGEPQYYFWAYKPN
jgi:SAM-dependent methyltransferase